MKSSKWIAVPTFYNNNTICFNDLNLHLKYIEPYYDNVIIMGSTGDQANLTLNEKISI